MNDEYQLRPMGFISLLGNIFSVDLIPEGISRKQSQGFLERNDCLLSGVSLEITFGLPSVWFKSDVFLPFLLIFGRGT
jgi:hypothetical protein